MSEEASAPMWLQPLLKHAERGIRELDAAIAADRAEREQRVHFEFKMDRLVNRQTRTNA